MLTRLAWTLLALATLGRTALADDDNDDDDTAGPAREHQPSPRGVAELGGRSGGAEILAVDPVRGGGSHRGVAQSYLVAPHGGEVTGQMRFVLSDPLLGDQKLKFSDLALFTMTGRWSLFSRLEISGSATFLPKQPSYTGEKPWQSLGVGLRSPLGKRTAVALTGGGGHLLSHAGMWTRQAMTLELRKPIARGLTFDVTGGVGGITLTAPRSSSAFITEVAVSTSALFDIDGKWGSWIGLGYALPVSARGTDPTTSLAVDPQPRLDFRVGTVFSLEKKWDVFAEYAVVDRGDLGNPATRLPILDGGFDQHQVMFGVTRHIAPKKQKRSYDPNHDDDAYELRVGRK
ncbi:MAG: hypothetical protein KIT31_12365 [Deltaproteobacteria bacterium]|nr:hypothetical protein [Deltaproteobacteria bacterium]